MTPFEWFVFAFMLATSAFSIWLAVPGKLRRGSNPDPLYPKPPRLGLGRNARPAREQSPPTYRYPPRPPA